MTKVIDFGGFIKLDLPAGEKLTDKDVVEVLNAEIVGTHDELLNPEPIYESYSGSTTTYQEIEIEIPSPIPGQPPQYIKQVIPIVTQGTKYREFDPQLNQYARLREKMCVKIKVRVVRNENVEVDSQR
jgi:hypothetical protein